MTPTLRACALIVLACTLASCGDSGKNGGKQASAGNSEILAGTISDDMIHYDTLRSEPPPAKIVADVAAGPKDEATKPAADSDEPAPDSPADGAAPDAAQGADKQAPAAPADADR